MDRVIMFRGKTLGGAWVEGNLLTHGVDYDTAIRVPSNTPVAGGAVIAVKPDTVGEFTGLTDKRGKRIFEGDIIKLQGGGGLLCFGEKEFIGVVRHDGRGGGLRSTLSRMYIKPINDELNEADYTPAKMEIIGNVYDNAELLEGATWQS